MQVVTVSIMILATAETAITIVAASIPILRVFVRNTLRSPSSQDASLNTQMSHTIRGFNFLTLPSPAQMGSFKESEFDPRLTGQFSEGMGSDWEREMERREEKDYGWPFSGAGSPKPLHASTSSPTLNGAISPEERISLGTADTADVIFAR